MPEAVEDGRNAHSPILLWQRGQKSRVESAFSLPEGENADMLKELSPLPPSVGREVGAGDALLDIEGKANDTRECVRVGVAAPEGATEFARETELGLAVADGADGDAIVQPKSATRRAVSEGSTTETGWGCIIEMLSP